LTSTSISYLRLILFYSISVLLLWFSSFLFCLFINLEITSSFRADPSFYSVFNHFSFLLPQLFFISGWVYFLQNLSFNFCLVFFLEVIDINSHFIYLLLKLFTFMIIFVYEYSFSHFCCFTHLLLFFILLLFSVLTQLFFLNSSFI
jgi:hypothetical protein